MTSDNLQLRRRAIVTGLKPFLDEAGLQRALKHWENRYADQPSTALQHYVADICHGSALAPQRRAVLRSLLDAGNLAAERLDALPQQFNESTPPAEAPVHRPRLSTASAFAALIQQLMRQLDDSQQTRLGLDYFAGLRQRKLSPAVLDAIQRGISNRQPIELHSAATPLLQKLINQYYIVLCEHVGPSQADRMLAVAVAAVQQHSPELDPFLTALL